MVVHREDLPLVALFAGGVEIAEEVVPLGQRQGCNEDEKWKVAVLIVHLVLQLEKDPIQLAP